jgi:2-keto-3-deoxy-galactonokinase
MIIAIDGGTTNTRVHLLKSGVVTDTIKLDMGVRINADGTEKYKSELKDAPAPMEKVKNIITATRITDKSFFTKSPT